MVVMIDGGDEPHEVRLAWQQLQEHRTDKATGDCVVCEVAGPCAVANDAAAQLVKHGVPVVERTHQPAADERRRAARLVLIARLRRRRNREGPSWP